MKILLVSDTYWPKVDGASIFTQRLARMLHERGEDVRVMAPSRHLRGEIFEHLGVKVFGMPSVKILWYPLRVCFHTIARRAVKKTIETWRPDVIHLQNHFYLGAMVVPTAKRLGIPVVGTNHFMPENLVHYFPPFIRKWLWGFAWRQFKGVYEQIDYVTTPAHASAKLLTDIGFRLPVHVISNGIDLTRFSPGPASPEVRQRYHIPAGPILLYVGRLDREKNLGQVLRAVALAKDRVKFTFVLVGTGQDQHILKQLAARLALGSSVYFAGFVDNADLPGIYRLGGAFVMAGTAELQSIVSMEAMATGLPVIAANALALPELVHDGQNGYLFTPGDLNSLVDKIVAVFSDESRRQGMGRQSYEIIQAHDINRTIDQFEAIYRSVVTKKPGNL